jgi:hypothetical protein
MKKFILYFFIGVKPIGENHVNKKVEEDLMFVEERSL